MPPVAGGAAAAQQTLLMKQFFSAMDQLSMRSVAKLDLEHPEQDYERWSLELIEIAKRAGHGALEALMLVGIEVPPPPAQGDPLADTLTALSIPQSRQAAMRSLIANSLPASEEPGSPRFLIRDMVNAGGTVNGVPQAWAALAARYAVAKVPQDPGTLLMELLTPAWPKELDTPHERRFHLRHGATRIAQPGECAHQAHDGCYVCPREGIRSWDAHYQLISKFAGRGKSIRSRA